MASAQPITFGNPASAVGNCVPFGCNAPYESFTGYQQVFAASAFSGPVMITGIHFYPLSGTSVGGAFRFGFAPTSVAVGSLSTNLASNITGPLTPFLEIGVAPGTSTSINVLAGPYLYNRPRATCC